MFSSAHVPASSFAVLYDIAQTDDGSVDIDMVVSIIMHICSTYSVESGSVLVFLPGWDEIVKVRDSLVAQPFFSRGAEWILSLHSAVPSHEQRKAFTRPPVGVWKIVLATNIAETSITIDDVVYVVDCGLVKEVRKQCCGSALCSPSSLTVMTVGVLRLCRRNRSTPSRSARP